MHVPSRCGATAAAELERGRDLAQGALEDATIVARKSGRGTCKQSDMSGNSDMSYRMERGPRLHARPRGACGHAPEPAPHPSPPMTQLAIWPRRPGLVAARDTGQSRTSHPAPSPDAAKHRSSAVHLPRVSLAVVRMPARDPSVAQGSLGMTFGVGLRRRSRNRLNHQSGKRPAYLPIHSAAASGEVSTRPSLASTSRR